MHGYDLMKEFKSLTGRSLKPAMVYPFLNSLEKKGYVIGTWVARGKRRVKSYSVTNKGEKVLSSVKGLLSMPVKDMFADLLRGES